MIDVKGLQMHQCDKTHQIVKPFANPKEDREALAPLCDSWDVFSEFQYCLFRCLGNIAYVHTSAYCGQCHKVLELSQHIVSNRQGYTLGRSSVTVTPRAISSFQFHRPVCVWTVGGNPQQTHHANSTQKGFSWPLDLNP